MSWGLVTPGRSSGGSGEKDVTRPRVLYLMGVMDLLKPANDGYSEITDFQVLDEVIHGNREMFEVLVRRYNQQLFRIGISYLRNPTQVEDAMQNTYLKAFMSLARFERRSSVSTWLTRIMINECLAVIRRRKSVYEVPFESAAEAEGLALPQGEASLTVNEVRVLLEKAIGELPRKLRTVYLLREVQQLTTEETAASLGISKEAVRVTLFRARERLRAQLMKNAAGIELFPYRAGLCDRLTHRVMSAILKVS